MIQENNFRELREILNLYAAAAAKLSHDEEAGRESRRAATGCPGSVGPILAAGETRL